VTQAALAGLPLGSGVSLTLPDLAAGTYHYTVSSTNVLGTGYGTRVYLGETVTHLDQYSPPSVTSIDGHLLDNDTTGSAFATLRVETGGHFVDVGNTPVQIAGAYGTLNIDAAGDYHYQPNANLAYSNTDPVDSFVYQIVQPNGTVATAQLNVTVDVNNGVAPASVSPLVAMQAVTNNMGHVSLTALSTESSGGGATGSPSGAHASALLTTGDSNSSVAAMLSRFLGEPHSVSTTQSTATVSAAHASTELTSAAGPPDPLGYLAPANDSEHERLAHLHTV
jgi:large repetitive protein